MPATFNKLGLRFTYPDNWTVDEAEALGGSAAVTVYSPGGSFWSVSLHPLETSTAALVKSAVKALRETYHELDEEAVDEQVGGKKLLGADLNFYYLDLTNTAQVRAFAGENFNVVILAQADDREFEQIAAVFQAMTVSLLANM
ncbi:MAG: hypothetical protein JNL96_20155 [Planctomycetaceae bacterium]|nr:hypothetical protein [Planctomycetaceae bacterium]